MVRIFNGTPHPINVVKNGVSNPEIRKISIPSDGMLSAKIETIEVDAMDGIPVFGKKVTACDPLPEGYDVVIVSALFVTAARSVGMETSRLFTVADPVYSWHLPGVLAQKMTISMS